MLYDYLFDRFKDNPLLGKIFFFENKIFQKAFIHLHLDFNKIMIIYF